MQPNANEVTEFMTFKQRIKVPTGNDPEFYGHPRPEWDDDAINGLLSGLASDGWHIVNSIMLPFGSSGTDQSVWFIALLQRPQPAAGIEGPR